jgi:hypothetical protein
MAPPSLPPVLRAVVARDGPDPGLRLGSSPYFLARPLTRRRVRNPAPARSRKTSGAPAMNGPRMQASVSSCKFHFHFAKSATITCMRPFAQPLDLDWAESAPARAIQCLIGRKAVMPKRESGWSQAVLVGPETPCGLGLRCGGDEGSKLFSSLGLSIAAAIV